MKKYSVTLSVCANIIVDADSPEQAEELALENFEDGKLALISAIEENGYEAEEDSYLTEEYNNENL